MSPQQSRTIPAILIWVALAAATLVPIAIAAASPLLAWRDPIYIVAGFAGIIALALLLIQPLLAGGYLPNLNLRQSRKLHAWVGAGLVTAVVIHVLALWITSPPDVIDVLLFRSPTPFSIWGVIAMWGVFAAGFLAAFRTRLGLKPALWRLCHLTIAVIIVVGTGETTVDEIGSSIDFLGGGDHVSLLMNRIYFQEAKTSNYPYGEVA